ncbi:hypothetical protein JHW45_06235 [Paracoccus stylophorae]|uniref:Uncharacterized protein n=1 Tax=Paracoccus stylophorae TaxID=659350 RepID=A0ABY7T036_9RHOB|nr:hypothetical protein [Paracoccus stylophorae]WCR11952.1 hypothetical protein JHW45_06235 [Paracoccus stylophorae]
MADTHTDEPDILTITKVDGYLQEALLRMVGEGVTVRFALSRLLTFTALQYVVNNGSEDTARIFREAAQTVEDGYFHHREGERPQPN